MSDDTIAIACDHGGLELKNLLKKDLEARGLSVLDLGTNSPESVDYPDYANAMAEAVKSGKATRGVLICGTGIGISIAANRHPEIRAALVHDAFTARMCREHNDANVLVLGGRTHRPGGRAGLSEGVPRNSVRGRPPCAPRREDEPSGLIRTVSPRMQFTVRSLF